MTYKKSLMAACLVAAMIAVPGALADDTNNTTPDPARVHEVADDLAVFEQQAADVSRNADILLSLSRNHRVSPESHDYYLGNLRHDINDMGRMLSELEQAKPQASEVQQMAVERARPHLERPLRVRPVMLSTCCEVERRTCGRLRTKRPLLTWPSKPTFSIRLCTRL